jgi:hypothetical protein
MDTGGTEALLPGEAWARSLTGEELAGELERAFESSQPGLTSAQLKAIAAEAARRLRLSVGAAHRESQRLPEKFRHG